MRRRTRTAAHAAALLLAVPAAACTSAGAPAATDSPSTVPPTAVPSSRAVSSARPSPVSTSAAPALAHFGHSSGYTVPDPKYTPGSVLAVGTAQVCLRTWNAAHKTISYQVQNAVSARYGLIAGAGTTIPLDQLIPASLGGSATQTNVWPQPVTPGHDGYKLKNELETHLHQLVCRGQVALATAQHAIAADWPAAQRKYSAIEVAP